MVQVGRLLVKRALAGKRWKCYCSWFAGSISDIAIKFAGTVPFVLMETGRVSIGGV
jgi:hypothetical protein